MRDELKEIDFEKYTILDYDISYIYMNEMYQYEKVEPHFLRILEERKKMFGENHPLTAKANYGIGLLYCRWIKGEEGFEYHKKAYDLRKQLTKQHPKVADYAYALALSANSMGRYLLDTGKPIEAYPYFNMALTKYDEEFVIDDKTTLLKDQYQGNYITSALNYVICLLKGKNYKEAQQEAHRCMDFTKKHLEKIQFTFAALHLIKVFVI